MTKFLNLRFDLLLTRNVATIRQMVFKESLQCQKIMKQINLHHI